MDNVVSTWTFSTNFPPSELNRGKTYEFTAWLKLPANDAGPNMTQLTSELDNGPFYDVLGASYIVTAKANVLSHATWKRVTLQIPYQYKDADATDDVYLRIQAEGRQANAGCFLVDNVSVVELP